MTKVKFGPTGLGGVKEAIYNLEKYMSLGFEACEIAFTRGIYIKRQKDAIEIGKVAKQFGIDLSIHAHYWINLNSKNPEVIKKSKQRILECCKVGTWLGAKRVVFHPGYYTDISKEQTYKNIKKQILEIEKQRRKNKYTPKLAPEIMGKVNVFGSIDEIANLAKETGCDFCIDFAHILARYDNYKFEEVFEKFKDYKNLHLHFSGIIYGDKGERMHKKTDEKEWKRLLENLPKRKDITIINESPEPVKDAFLGLELYYK